MFGFGAQHAVNLSDDVRLRSGQRIRCTLNARSSEMPVTEQDVLSALKSCYDPEIPVNIVDLGLIYKVDFTPAESEKQDVSVDMTLTAQGCPEHVNISMQVKSRLEQLPGVRNVAVNVVWSPPWTPERLSPEARKQLGIE
jgi:metal-sulfur cluster biosynthetic enzyme